jgi:hypothetical protein
MAITKLTKHDSHQVRIHLTRGAGPHHAALRCVECNVHIQWLNPIQTQSLKELGVEVHNKIQENFYD